jgi:hypothetical protein
MSIDPFFSLSPRNPRDFTYLSRPPNAPYALAYLYTYGGHTSAWETNQYGPGDLSLTGQYDQDQILLAWDPVPDTDQTLPGYPDSYRNCAVRVGFAGTKVSTRNQYLLFFGLARAGGSPIAQFFVGTQFVRGEALTQSPYDDIAILLDTPGNQTTVYVTVRLAVVGGPTGLDGFYFKGVDGYLL